MNNFLNILKFPTYRWSSLIVGAICTLLFSSHVLAASVEIDFELSSNPRAASGAEATNLYLNLGVRFPSRPTIERDRGTQILQQGSGLRCAPLIMEFSPEMAVREVRMRVINRHLRSYSVQAFAGSTEVDVDRFTTSPDSGPPFPPVIDFRDIVLRAEVGEGNITRVVATPPSDCFDLMMIDNLVFETVRGIVPIAPVSAKPRVERAKAWVWASQPTIDEYAPPLSYQYNSAGGRNYIIRSALGAYQVSLPELGTTGGMVHVSAYGGNHYCKVKGWWPSGTTQRIGVNCFSPAGNPIDGRFTALFYRESRGEAWRDAFLWADQPVATEYTPNLRYQWNSRGFQNRVRRLSKGQYEAMLPGIDRIGGTVLVTAYGADSERCKVVEWDQSENDTLVWVNCFDSNGKFVDTRYTLSYMKDVGLGIQYSEQQHYGGYVWANQPTTPNYIPHETYQLNTAAEPNTASWNPTGSYAVRFPLLKPSNSSTAQVTAYGTGSEYCTIASWNGRAGDYTSVNVKCYGSSGQPVNTQFTLTYLTDEQILY
ncbi:MAG: hypothetical protein AAF702_46875 [Chloroflexota bacterium]